MTYIEIGLRDRESGGWEAWEWGKVGKIRGETKADALRKVAEEIENGE